MCRTHHPRQTDYPDCCIQVQVWDFWWYAVPFLRSWLWQLLSCRHMVKKVIFSYPLVMVEQAQDKLQNSTGKRKGRETWQSLVHEFWDSVRTSLKFLRLSIWLEEILSSSSVLLSEEFPLDHISLAHKLSSGSSFSSIYPLLFIRHILVRMPFLGVCVAPYPFFLRGCVGFQKKASSNHPPDFFGKFTETSDSFQSWPLSVSSICWSPYR